MNYLPIILLLAGGVIVTIGDIAMKKWVVSNLASFYLIGMIIYIVGLNFLAQSFKYRNIAVASVMFIIFNVVTLSIVSWLYFKEPLSTPNIIGMALGIIAVIVMELPSV